MNVGMQSRAVNAGLGEPSFIDLGHSQIAYRKIGAGEPLLLVHGYPLSGLTFRHILPQLAQHFTCYVPDTPGLGETRWTKKTDFNFAGQAKTLREFVDRLGLRSYSILAHDTGATIARRLTTLDVGNVRKLVMIGTEIPNHRPPAIELLQKIANPNNSFMLRNLMTLRAFRRSRLAFKEVFYDLRLLDGEFYTLFVEPLIKSRTRAIGSTRYLLGIDWKIVDGMKTEHAKITCPTLFIWGEDDKTFPLKEARAMVGQLPDCRGIIAIPKAKLFVHEEKPAEVAKHALDFLTAA